MHSHGYFPRRNEKKTCHTLRVQELYCLIYSLKMPVLHTVYSLFLFFFLGRGVGRLFERGRLFNTFSLKGAANLKGGAYLKGC